VIHHSDQRLQREAHGDVRFPVETPMASHRKDVLGAAAQGKAIQSNADRPLATAGFPGRFGPSEVQRISPHRTASRCKATQSNADCPLATAGFPGRFGSPGRVSSAALSTD
jgi:hypothetical protein